MALVMQAAEEGSQQAKNPILPATNEIIWGTLAFLVLLIGMWKFAFHAVTKAMNERTERIRSNLDSAENLKGEAQQILDEYQRQLADAKSEANRIIEEARQTAEALRRDLMQRAEAEVAELRQRSAEDVAAAQERALNDLRARISTLVISAAEKVVERNLDRETNTALVESFINSVGAMSV